MATSTYKSFLMKGTGSGESMTWQKLIDIVDYPDLGGAPEMLDATTQSDKMRVNIEGIQDLDSLTFTANYDPEDFAALEALKGVDTPYAVWFGGTEAADGTVTPTGDLGKFSWNGTLSAWVTGSGVNEVRRMSISIANSTVISFEQGN